MIAQMLDNVIAHRNAVADLKGRSPYFPCILREQRGNKIYLSSMVRKEFDGLWYKIHHVVTIDLSDRHTPAENKEGIAVLRLSQDAWYTIHLYKRCGMEDVDSNQEDEAERLRKLVGD